jgi:hypothetical protein
MAIWVELSFAESGKTVKPGSSLMVNLSITLPKTVDKRSSYFGSIRLITETGIEYRILAD